MSAFSFSTARWARRFRRSASPRAIFAATAFSRCECHQQGNNDLLTLTQPEAIEDIHFAYAMAGADILETNTFSSTSIAQADYGMQDAVYELNRDGARLARRAAVKAERADGRSRFVAGALGPTNRTASLSPDVNNPGFRAVTFDDLAHRLRRADPRPDRRRRRPNPDRDDLRHAERQGGDLRLRGSLRRSRRPPAADDFGNDHRPLRPHSVGPDADRLLALGPPCAPASPSASIARSARARCESIWRRSPTSRTRSSAPIPTPACRTPSASTMRARRRWPLKSPASPATVWSTSSAAAAARRPSTSARSPRRSVASSRAPSRPSRR